VATFLIEGDAFVAQFTEDKVADPARMAFSRRVEVVEDPQITALGSRYRHKVRVEVRLKNGEVHEETVEAPRGSEKRFATDQDVIAKFRKLAATRLADPQIDRITDLVMNAERMASARDLATALGA
jgi:aconitate decarboxylase